MSTQEPIQNYGKPAYWSDAKWEAWKRELAQHFSPSIFYTVLPTAIQATVQHVERLRAYGGNGPVIAVIEHEGKRYKGILFEMEGE